MHRIAERSMAKLTGTECWDGHRNSGSRSCGSSRNGSTTDSILAFALLYGQTACALPRGGPRG